jgi:predicted nucleic acid-binding protein
LLNEDKEIVVWTYTATEIFSALYRRHRDRHLLDRDLDRAKSQLIHLQRAWTEVLPRQAVRQRAHRLLATHALRAADALQLAAALHVSHDSPEGEYFITFDHRLASAARKEGFIVLTHELVGHE